MLEIVKTNQRASQSKPVSIASYASMSCDCVSSRELLTCLYHYLYTTGVVFIEVNRVFHPTFSLYDIQRNMAHIDAPKRTR